MENNMKSRKEKMKDELLDTSANEAVKLGNEAISFVFQELKEMLLNKYNNFKSSKTTNTDAELKKLEMRISVSNKSVEIGMEKKEIAVMWAMKRLGYSKEETQKVLDLANEAYNPPKNSD